MLQCLKKKFHIFDIVVASISLDWSAGSVCCDWSTSSIWKMYHNSAFQYTTNANIVTCSVLEENSRLQWRRFREFSNTDTDIENHSLQTFFFFYNLKEVEHVKTHKRTPLI